MRIFFMISRFLRKPLDNMNGADYTACKWAKAFIAAAFCAAMSAFCFF